MPNVVLTEHSLKLHKFQFAVFFLELLLGYPEDLKCNEVGLHLDSAKAHPEYFLGGGLYKTHLKGQKASNKGVHRISSATHGKKTDFYV